MNSMVDAHVLRVYLGRATLHAGKPLYEWIVGEARKRGLAGATVYRGVMGFGGNCRLHTAKILRLAEDLPVIVEIVDTPGRIADFLPVVDAVVQEGTLVLEEARAIFRMPRRIRDIMCAEVVTITPETPLSGVVRLLLQRRVKAVPVVDGDRLVGIITGGDLLRRAGMPLRLDIQRLLPPRPLGECIRVLERGGLAARDVMSSPVATINIRMLVRDAVKRMASAACKRLPVVDDLGNLVGIVSRVDVLRSVGAATAHPSNFPAPRPGGQGTARDVMFTEVPTVGPDAPLPEVLDKLLASPFRRVVVVDAKGKVAGIILDRDMVEHCARQNKPGLLQALIAALSGKHGMRERFVGTARNAMQPDVLTVRPDTALEQVVRVLVEKRVKRLVVADDEGHFCGMVDRNAILRGLAGYEETGNDLKNAL